MIFGELDYRLSVVKRWGVVQTIRSQSVAEHSYNVAIIAERLALKMFPSGYVTDKMYPITASVLHLALHHDRNEAITGDFPSYMKAFVDENAAVNAVPASARDEDLTMEVVDPIAKFIVKCADYIDACVFLRMEMSLGNKSVQYHLRHLEARFRKYASTGDPQPIYQWYMDEVLGVMFGGNGQYVSEIDGFPKTP